MRKSGQIEKGIMYTLAVLLCLTLTSVWLTSNLYARYATSASGSDSAQVAVFRVDENAVSEDAPVLTRQFCVSLAPGESEECAVQVTNSSEVAVDYSISVKNEYKNLPLTFTFEKDGATFVGEETNRVNDTLEAGEAAHTYTLEVSWPKNSDSTSPAYAGKADIFTVTLRAEQKD